MSKKKQDVTTRALLTLSYFGKIGPRGFSKLSALPAFLQHEFNHWSHQQLTRVGIAPELAIELMQFAKTFDYQAELQRLQDRGIQLLSFDDSHYPPLLKHISDPPYLLYAMGDVASLHHASLAVVGSRKHTHYGRLVIERIVPDLAHQDITIVSGLAYGIDALAHRAALEARGTTVAVVGTGLDVLYPSDHTELAKQIIACGGAIISEYPLGTPPLKQHFPARNRIIAGVTQGTLVVECDIKSGAMITAHHALEQNRDVYAVPGPITSPLSAGPNNLLRMGARVVMAYDDVIEQYGITRSKRSHHAPSVKPETLPASELQIFDILGQDPIHIDMLVEQSKLDMAEVNSALLFLEMKGMVRNVGAAQYIRR